MADAPVPTPTPPSRRARAQEWVDQRRARLEAARGTSMTVGFAFDALSYDTETGAPVLAAALGFRLFLFLVPYVCFVLVGSGVFADLTGREATDWFHGAGILHLTAEAVSNVASLSGWGRFTALALTAYAVALTARSLVKVLYIVHALVWDVPRARLRNTNRAALGLVLFVTALVVLSILIARLYDRSTVGGLVVLVLYASVPFTVWWMLSYRLPHRDCPLGALAPGAALFAIGAELLHLATVIWFPHYFASKSDLYGTIGTAVAMLLWAYLLGRLITLAAVINASLWARVEGEPGEMLVARPNVRLPLLDDKLTRAWIALFGARSDDGDPT